MPIRAFLALLLLFPAAAPAQELDLALRAVVKISGTRDGAPVQGSGFVVRLEPGKATIVTASHVIEELQKVEVTFAADLTESFSAEAWFRVEMGDPHGVAVLSVRGSLPAGVTTLAFELEKRPSSGDDLFLVGFPEMVLEPRTPRRVLAGRHGKLLAVDQKIGEGFSGGPVLQGGKVVGVVTDTDEGTTFAVNAVVVREVLEGWGVKLGVSTSPPKVAETKPKPPPPPATPTCQPGEESRVNGIDFVRICAGTFTMGSRADDPRADSDEKPAHEVTLNEFWIGRYEITNEQYRTEKADRSGEAKLPAAGVSWLDAKAFCEKLPDGRLPTEAEWEYAARADTKTAWSFGDDEMRLGAYAWYDGNSGFTTHPVGQKEPNPWGLYDMHGNVWEWVTDWYGPYGTKAEIYPTGPSTGEFRGLRGGSFIYSPRVLRSAVRGRNRPSGLFGDFGFRCVIAPRRQP